MGFSNYRCTFKKIRFGMEVFPVNHHNEQKEGKHNSEHVLKFLIPNLLDVGNDFSDHFLPDFLFFGDEKLTDILISI